MTENEYLIKVKADTDKAIKEINKLNKELADLKKTSSNSVKSSKDIEQSYKKLGKTTAVLSKQIATLATAYLSFQGAKEIVSITSELQSGFIEVAKTTGITGDAFKELEQDIFKLSTSMAGVSVEELQGVAATAGQLGIQGSKDILEFTRVIAMMGTATDLTAQQAAEAMAGLGHSLDVPVQEFERLGSTIDKVSDNSSASAANLVEYSQRIAGVGKTFGLTADEVIAFGATLKDVGISAELGGTALSKVMLEMIRNVDGFAKASGVSLEEFSTLIKDKPVKALELFLTSLSKLDKSAKVQVLDDLKLKSSGATQTILKLSDGMDLLTKNLNTAKTEWKSNTALMKSYTTASSGFDAQMDTFKNQIKELAYKVGVELLPYIQDLAKDTGKWVESIDNKKIETFATSIKTLAESFGYLIEKAKTAHDYTAPDFLFGDGVGIVEVLGTHLLALSHAFNEVTYDATKLNDAMNEQKQKFDGAAYAINNMALTSNNLDALKQSISDIISENEKLIKQYNATHSQKQKAAALELVKVNKELKETLTKLNTDEAYKNLSKDIDKADDASKKLADTTKKYTETEIKELSKLNLKRVKDAEKTSKSLAKTEEKLAKEIVTLNQNLAKELASIANDRFKLNQDIESRIAELKRGALSEDAAYYDKQKEAERVLSDAKIALKNNEFEKYKYFIDQYDKLVTDSAGQEIKVGKKVAVSGEETRKRAIDGLNNIQQLENAYLDKKQAAAQAVHDQEVANKKIEIDLVKLNIEAQLELIKLAAEPITPTTDLTPLNNLLAKIDGLKTGLDSIQSTPAKVSVDSTSVDVAKQKVEEVKTLTLNGVTLEVTANTTPADFDINKLVTKVGKDSIEMDVNPKYTDAQKKLDEFRKSEDSKDVTVGVDADTSSAGKKIATLKKPTDSLHKVVPNTTAAQRAIDNLKKPTSSTHTVYERVVPARSLGGRIPQKLATGGRFTGSGKVPGYDATDSDRVNAKLTGGEYVINRRAVDKIGLDTLHAINQFRFNIPKFATGGLVGNAPSQNTVATVPKNFGTLNLAVGDKTFPALVPEEVADALTKYINTQGGL